MAEPPISEEAQEIDAAQQQLNTDLGRPPTIEEISEKTGQLPEEVERGLVEKEVRQLATTDEATPAQRTVRIDHEAPKEVEEERNTGICLSGGGIRAATFAMGALQALQAPPDSDQAPPDSDQESPAPDTLRQAQFLTAVSGGGYFGGAYEMARSHGIFEFAPATTPKPFAPGTVEELHVRQRSSFLAQTAREKLHLASHLLTGIGINVLFLAGVLYLILRPVGWFLGALLEPGFSKLGTDLSHKDWFGTRLDHLRDLLPSALWYAVGVIVAIAALFAIIALVSWVVDLPAFGLGRGGRRYSIHLSLRRWSDSALLFALVVLVVVVVIPVSVWLFYDLFPGLLENGPAVINFFTPKEPGGDFLALFAAGGSLAFVAAAAKNQLAAIKPTWWARIAAFVIVPLMVLWVVAVLVRGAMENGATGSTRPLGMPEIVRWGLFLLLLCIFWLLADQRSWSMYPIYRERLENAFAVERLWGTPGSPDELEARITEALRKAFKENGIKDEEADQLIGYVDPSYVAKKVATLRPDLIPTFLDSHLTSPTRRRLLGAVEVESARRGLYEALDQDPSAPGGRSATVAQRIPSKERQVDPLTEEKWWSYIDFSRTIDDGGDTARAPLGPRFVSCAAANIRDAERTAPDLRAASFHFDRKTIGSPHNAIGEIDTDTYKRVLDGTIRRQDVTVPAAMAMSGAAISPAMGKHSKGWLSAFMALANARLGVWLPNPRWMSELVPTLPADPDSTTGIAERREGKPPYWFEKPRVSYLLKEIFGIHAIDDRFLYITDGGHYDNLGLVELLRKACNTIYVIDASGDEPGVFTTLGQAMALARAELGITFDINLDKLRGEDKEVAEHYEEKRLRLPWRKRTSEERGGVLMDGAYVWGTFYYRAADGTRGVKGDICYIQTAVTKNTPWQVRTYWEADPRFPNHSTMDQSFTHEEFEAYRALGYWAAKQARKKPATS